MSDGDGYPEQRGYGYYRWEYQETGAALAYVPFAGQSENASTGAATVSIDLPYGGRVLRVTGNQNTGTPMDTTTIGVHLGAAGAAPDGTAAETQDVEISATDASFTANFSSLTSFAAGARLSLSVDPETSSAGGFLQGMLVVKFEG